jgi:hypothetical protein
MHVEEKCKSYIGIYRENNVCELVSIKTGYMQKKENAHFQDYLGNIGNAEQV